MHCISRTLPSVKYEKIFNKQHISTTFTCRKISDAVYEQMSTLGHVSNVYYHPKIHEYAEKLTDKLPGDLKVSTEVSKT